MLFHHDPLHSDDFLDDFSAPPRALGELGGDPRRIEMAAERRELEVTPPPSRR